MIVKCEACGKGFDDQFRLTTCPHNTFSANDGKNNFAHYPNSYLEGNARHKPILCVDFDGVIHSYASGWQGADMVGDPPVKGALLWLYEAGEYFNVQVYSSRSSQPGGIAAMTTWMLAWATKELGADHPMAKDLNNCAITFPAQKPAAFLTIDDRAICFRGDWDQLDAAELLDFRPWNKRS